MREDNLEKLRWARRSIKEKTNGKQVLTLGWDEMPKVKTAEECMVGLYAALLKNHKTGLYDFRAKGYIRTCGGYSPSARMQDLINECMEIAELVKLLEDVDIHATEAEVKRFCAELKGEEGDLHEETNI